MSWMIYYRLIGENPLMPEDWIIAATKMNLKVANSGKLALKEAITRSEPKANWLTAKLWLSFLNEIEPLADGMRYMLGELTGNERLEDPRMLYAVALGHIEIFAEMGYDPRG